jgi:hypothetical protein
VLRLPLAAARTAALASPPPTALGILPKPQALQLRGYWVPDGDDLFSDSASSISYEPLKAAVSDGSIIQHLPFRGRHGSGADDAASIV